MDLVHYFFYFGIAFLECLTFAQMERPADWFAFSLACFVTAWVLYLYDYRLIQRARSHHQARRLVARSSSTWFEASASRCWYWCHSA